MWFYDLEADGFSLDDKRTPLLDADKLGPVAKLSGDEHERNNLPDALVRWDERAGTELERARTEQSFCVPKGDIVANDYDLSINRYKEIVYDEVEHRPPLEIIADIEKLNGEIAEGMDELKAMLT